jgi:hypothetical protein
MELGWTVVMHKEVKSQTKSYVHTLHYGLVLNPTALLSHRTVADSILSLLFKMENIIEENPYSLSVLLFDKPLTSQKRSFTSSFIFKSKHFHFIVVVLIEHSLA